MMMTAQQNAQLSAAVYTQGHASVGTVSSTPKALLMQPTCAGLSEGPLLCCEGASGKQASAALTGCHEEV